MMKLAQKIAPCLWFDHQAEEAANCYVGIFPNSKITSVARYGEAGKEAHGRPPGSVMTVAFELDGQPFTALNGGPVFHFTEAISFQVSCDSQAELDRYWEKLSAGGDEKAQQCGWLKDRFGVSWQIVPSVLPDLVKDPGSEKSQRAVAAMMKMKKLDIAELQRAYAG
jgi:predicted 3-demethylubiquinone-9 3-methyltransferase (glyoxalase superfamily)